MLRARSHKGSWPGPQQDCTSALRRSGLTAWPDAAKQPASTHSVARQAGRQVGRLAGTSGSGKAGLRAHRYKEYVGKKCAASRLEPVKC